MASQAPSLELRSKAAPSSNAPAIIAINGVFTGIALLVVGLRVLVRLMVLRNRLGSDDWVILVAMICSIVVLICFIFETKYGVGRHIQDITTPQMEELLHWQFYHSIVVMTGVSLVKISIGLFLMRFVQHKTYKRVIIGMIVFLILFTISCAGTLIFACIPVAASWNFALKATATCYSTRTFTDIGLYNSAVNIVTDVVFAMLPIPIIWNLQINKRTKISLSFILSLGLFVCACAIYKMYLQSIFYQTPDWPRNDSYFVWNSAEFHVAIVAASLPTLRPIFASCIEGTRSAIRRTTNRSGAGTHGGGNTAPNKRRSIYGPKSAISLASMPSSRHGDPVLVSKNGAITHETKIRYETDDGSEENILPMHGQTGIVVRKDYDVAWEEEQQHA